MADGRFTSQGSHAEDLLKTQTIGLVNLDEFRKRRAEAIEQSEREQDGRGSQPPSQTPSGAVTPSERGLTPQPQMKKRRKAGKGKLSFALDDEEEDAPSSKNASKRNTPASSKQPQDGTESVTEEVKSYAAQEDEEALPAVVRRRLGPNASIANAPKVMTKSALQKEAQERERLRKEFLSMQEDVKATEIVVPFVFYDGSNTPGGACRVKKGDPIWVFLDKCRKMGAELRVGATNEARSRREWARVGVDDLMLVRKEIIIPHHYEFYYFIVNKSTGHDSLPLFDFSPKPTDATRAIQAAVDAGTYNPLSKPGENRNKSLIPDSSLEGFADDPDITKVVNRQWYERNKHIFPASTWEEFDSSKDYTNAPRRDAQGNAYFFSR